MIENEFAESESAVDVSNSEAQVEDVQPQVEAAEKPEQKTETRAERRIQTLVRRTKEYEGKLEELQRELQRRDEELNKVRQSSVEAVTLAVRDRQSSLENQLESLTAQALQAEQEGDIAKKVKVNTALAQVSAQLERIKDLSSRYKEAPRREADAPAQQVQAPTPIAPAQQPQAFKRWVRDNSKWWGKDIALSQAAAGIAQELINEGYDPSNEDDDDFGSESFVKEVDRRLKEDFGPRLQRYQGATPQPSRGSSMGKPSVGFQPAPTVNKQVSEAVLSRAKAMGIKPPAKGKSDPLWDKFIASL